MNIYVSVLLSFLLAGLAFIKKAMTIPALILAFVCSIIICFYGGLCYFLILVSVFLSTLIASKIKKEKRKKINSDTIEKDGKKDIFQIIANVGLGTLSIILYAINKNSIFLGSYAAIMAESISDSLASDIGVLSRRKPFNILTFKKSEPGLSGNVSVLGLCSSFVGSLLIGFIHFIFNNSFWGLIITVSGFLGALLDSYLGALFQVKYKCCKCDKITEKKQHCGENTIHYRGVRFINNDMVNFLGNLFAFLFALFLFYITN